MSRWLPVLAAALSVAAASATARSFTVDDLLHQASFGQSAFDPSGRWVVFEQRDPYDSLSRYDHNLSSPTALSRLKVLDLAKRGREVRDLLPPDLRGVVMGPFSPSGARLVVYRWRDDGWSLGIVTLSSGAVRWVSATPDVSIYGRAAQWRSERQLLLLDRADGSLPWDLRSGRLSAERLPALWAAQARGEAVATVLGSGRYRDLNPPGRPRRLLQVDAETGAFEVLATGAFGDLELSPDGRRLALFESGGTVQPRGDGPSQGPAGLPTEAHHLRVLDLATGGLSAPSGNADLLPHLLSWSPSGRSLLVFRRGQDALWPSGQLLRVEPATARTTSIGADISPDFRFRPEILGAGWMGETPILRGRPRTGGRLDWWRLGPGAPVNLTRALPAAPSELRAVDAAGAIALAEGQAWRLAASGAAVELPGRYQPLRDPALSQNERLEAQPPSGSWVLETAGSGQELRWMGPTGPTVRVALPAPLSAGAIAALSKPGRRALVTQRDDTGVERLALADETARAIATTNLGQADTDLLRPIAIAHVGPTGQPLTSWLFLPARPTSSRPPLVVKVYAGASYSRPPKDAAVDRGFVANLRVLTGHGYAVLTPSLPIPAGADPAAGLGERIVAIVDAAAATPGARGTFDPQRVAILGHSYGGYATMAAISQTDRFKAAVSIAGISSLFAIWEYQPSLHRAIPEEGLRFNWSTGYTESSQGGMGVPPWRDPQRYLRNSPLFSADRVTTPLLLMHGDQDIVPLPQSEAMFSALFRQSKDAILVTYWGEGHGIMSPGNVHDLYQRLFAFLDAHLSAAPVTAPSRSPRPEPGPASGAPTLPAPRPAAPPSGGRSR